jgi:hypothetical protein
MTRFSMALPQRQARIVYLALRYHLARPGSEVDPETLQEYARGLAEVRPHLEAQLEAEEATLELTPFQLIRLDTALLSIINELKTYPLLDTMAGGSQRPRSLAPGFDELLRRLFPQVAEDASSALDVAEEALMLHRALRAHVARARELLDQEREERERTARRSRRRWQFWRRS